MTGFNAVCLMLTQAADCIDWCSADHTTEHTTEQSTCTDATQLACDSAGSLAVGGFDKRHSEPAPDPDLPTHMYLAEHPCSKQPGLLGHDCARVSSPSTPVLVPTQAAKKIQSS